MLELEIQFLYNNLSRLINSTTANQKQSLPVVSSRLPFSDLFSKSYSYFRGPQLLVPSVLVFCWWTS